MYAKDLQGRLLFANPATLRLIGKPLDQVLGHTDAEFLEDPEAAHRVMTNDRRILATGVAEEVEELVPLPDGSERVWLSQKMPFRDGDGTVLGLLGISRDITERKRATSALRDSEQRLRLALDATDLGVWDLDLETDTALRSLRHDECFGYTELQPRWGIEVALRHIVEDDHPVLLDAFTRAAGTGSFEIELRVRWPDGSLHWIHALGRMAYHPDGTPSRLSGVVRDITTERTAALERERLLADLQAAHAVKDEFLATLSHELRTPLNVVLGHARMLRQRPEPPESVSRAAAIVERNAVAQMRMVEDLLDVQRVLRGGIPIAREAFDVTGLVYDLVESLQPQALLKGQRLVVDLVPLAMEGDRTRVQQALWNLLTNALKFTGEGGTVTVSARETDGQVELQVVDDGAGIPPEFLPHLFEPFRQADMSTTRRHGGLGLGLAIVRSIAHAHGGSIGVETRSADAEAGRGTRFTLRLPKVRPPSQG